ncbi:MAG: hypothetical protein PHS54_00260 [Clostridia bacterium]|nr:hypothetical protein [Clostridia bacterium]
MKNTFRKAMSGIACPRHKRTKIILRKDDGTPYGFIKKHIADSCPVCLSMIKDPEISREIIEMKQDYLKDNFEDITNIEL